MPLCPSTAHKIVLAFVSSRGTLETFSRVSVSHRRKTPKLFCFELFCPPTGNWWLPHPPVCLPLSLFHSHSPIPHVVQFDRECVWQLNCAAGLEPTKVGVMLSIISWQWIRPKRNYLQCSFWPPPCLPGCPCVSLGLYCHSPIGHRPRKQTGLRRMCVVG